MRLSGAGAGKIEGRLVFVHTEWKDGAHLGEHVVLTLAEVGGGAGVMRIKTIRMHRDDARRDHAQMGMSAEDVDKLFSDFGQSLDLEARDWYGRTSFEVDPAVSPRGDDKRITVKSARFVEGGENARKANSRAGGTLVSPAFSPVRVPYYASPQTTRIGYATLTSPIHYIEQHRESRVDAVPVLRQSGEIQRASGQAYQSYTLSYTVSSPLDILTGVKDVVDQLALTPFTTVEGGPFGALNEVGEIATHEIAVRNFSISTVDGLPGTLQVDISFDPFMWDWYTPPTEEGDHPREHMDDMICWPLVKLWARSRERSRYDGSALNGRFVLSYPTQKATIDMTDLLRTGAGLQGPGQDVDALRSLRALLKGEGGTIRSRYAKEILSTDAKRPRHYVLKISDRVAFDRLAGARPHATFEGLIFWEKMRGWNYVNDRGEFLPQSGRVYEGFLAPEVTTGEPARETANADTPFLDVPRGGTIPAAYAGAPQEFYGLVFKAASGAEKASLLAAIDELLTHAESKEVAKRRTILEGSRDIMSRDGGREVVLEIDPQNPGLGVRSDIVIEAISGSRSHNLAATSTQVFPLPVHQYVGGLSAQFVVTGKCLSLDAKRKMEALKEEFEHRALGRHSHKYSGAGSEITDPTNPESLEQAGAFLMIENEIFQMLGVDFVMPITLDFRTVDGQPGVWEWTMSLLEMDPRIRKAEQVQFLPTGWQALGRVYKYGWTGSTYPTPLLDRGREWFSLQGALAQEEVYPDMQLPTRGEYEFWLRTLTKAARKIALGEKALTEPAEAEVIAHAYQFLSDPAIAADIAKWPVPQTGYTSDAEAGSFMDPDFYCYYEPGQEFESIFDLIVRRSLGKKRDDQSAEGVQNPSDPSTPPVPLIRKHLTEEGVTLVHPPKEYAASAASAQADADVVLQGYGMTSFPGERAKQMRELDQKAQAEFEQTPGKWWNVDLSAAGGDDKHLYAKFRDFARVFQSEETLIGQTNAPQAGDKGKIEGLDIAAAPEGLQDFFRVGWRQDMTRLAGRVGRSRPMLTHVQLGGSQSFIAAQWEDPLWVALGARQGMEYEVLESNFKALLNGDRNKTITQVAADKIDATTSEEPPYSFLQKTVLSNASFEAFGRDRSLVPDPSGLNVGDSPHARMIASREWFDYVGAYYSVDPHILRAFFHRRTQFGLRQDDTSTPDTVGWGELHSDLGGGRTDARMHVDLFARTYAANLRRFDGVPSVALIATRMELTNQRSTYVADGKLRPEVERDLAAASAQVKAHRFDEAGLHAIRTLVGKYDRDRLLDQIYTGYVEISRILGPYTSHRLFGASLRENVDPLFHPLNPLIMTDMYQGREDMVTNHTPSGEQRQIRLDRRALHADTAAIERFYPSDAPRPATEELASRLERKLQAAQDPQTEDAIYGMLYDLRNHSPFGRLVGAFPCFQVLFVNEGFYWNGGDQKLWDQFYTRTAVSAIELFRSRHDPAHSCSVTFSNMYHTITAYNLLEATAHEMALRNAKRTADVFSGVGGLFKSIADLWRYAVVKDIPEDVARTWQHNQLQRLALTPGTRLQVRMGYGSNAAGLPVVFNGTIVDVPLTEGEVTVLATGDGGELQRMPSGSEMTANNAYAYIDKGFMGIGKPPSNIVTELLVGPNWKGALSRGKFRQWEDANTTHFGEIFYGDRDGGLLNANAANLLNPSAGLFAGFSINTDEIQINIYNSSSTALEQRVPSIRNFFNVNALYNWGKENNFSVQVSEPTTWKVVEVCRRACLDFVASAEPFATRSSLFFGKWWWPLNYGYDESILDVMPETKELQNAGSGFSWGFATTPALGVFARMPDTRLLGKPMTVPPKASPAHKASPTAAKHERSPGPSAPLPLPPSLHDMAAAVWVAVATEEAKRQKALLPNQRVTWINQHSQDFVKWVLEHKYSLLRDTINRITKLGSGFADRDVVAVYDAFHDWEDGLRRDRKTELARKQAAEERLAELRRRTALMGPVGELLDLKQNPDGTTARDDLGLAIDDAANALLDGIASLGHAPILLRVDAHTNVEHGGSNPLGTLGRLGTFGPLFQVAGERAHAGPSLVLGATAPPPILQTGARRDGVRPVPQNTIGGTLPDLLQHLRWKTFTQAYIAHSGINLLSNDIRATGDEGLYTDAIGQHVYNGYTTGDSVIRTITYSIDSDIQPGDRKVYLADTGILLTGVQAGWSAAIRETVGRFNPNAFGLGAPTTPAIENAVVQSLVDQAKEMYQGWFMITGQPTMKPHDIVLLTDMKNQLAGPVFVKEVIHRFDCDTGMKTMVSPDLVVLPHSSILGARFVTSLALGALGELGSFMVVRSAQAGLKAMIRGAYNRRLGFHNAANLDEYWRVLEQAGGGTDLGSEAVVHLKKQLNVALDGVDQAKLAERVGGADKARALRIEARQATNLKDIDRLAKQMGVALKPQELEGALGVQARILLHEQRLQADAAQMLKDVEGMRFGSEREKRLMMERLMNDRRIAFTKKEGDGMLRFALDDDEIVELRRELKRLRGVRGPKAAQFTEAADKLEAEIAKKMSFLSDGDKTRLVNRLVGTDLKPLFLEPDALTKPLQAIADVPNRWAKVAESTVKGLGKGTAKAGGAVLKGTAQVIQGGAAKGAKVVTFWDKTRGFATAAKQPSSATKFVATAKNTAQELRDVIRGAKAAEEVEVLVKTAQAAVKARKLAKGVYSGARMAKYLIGAGGGPVGIALAFATDVAQLILFDSTIGGYNKMLGARQAVIIFPLRTVGGAPYVAGIRGHQGAVVGDQPGFVDALYAGLLRPGENKALIWNFTGWVAALTGIEVPDYGNVEIDTQHLEKVKELFK